MMLGGSRHIAVYAIELFVYWSGLCLVFAMYLLLLLFWSNVCKEKNMMTSWLGVRPKIIFIVLQSFLVALTTFFLILSLVQTEAAWQVYTGLVVNAILVIIVIGLAVTAVIEGNKVVKTLSTMHAMHGQKVLRRVTFLSKSASIALIVSVGGLIVGTGIRSIVKENFVLCQCSHLLFRTLELIVIGAIAIPMRDYKVDQHSSSLKKGSIALSTASDLARTSAMEDLSMTYSPGHS